MGQFGLVRFSLGMPPHTWIAARRIERARHLLKSTHLRLELIANACGFTDVSQLSDLFRQEVGVLYPAITAALSTGS